MRALPLAAVAQLVSHQEQIVALGESNEAATWWAAHFAAAQARHQRVLGDTLSAFQALQAALAYNDRVEARQHSLLAIELLQLLAPLAFNLDIDGSMQYYERLVEAAVFQLGDRRLVGQASVESLTGQLVRSELFALCGMWMCNIHAMQSSWMARHNLTPQLLAQLISERLDAAVAAGLDPQYILRTEVIHVLADQWTLVDLDCLRGLTLVSTAEQYNPAIHEANEPWCAHSAGLCVRVQGLSLGLAFGGRMQAARDMIMSGWDAAVQHPRVNCKVNYFEWACDTLLWMGFDAETRPFAEQGLVALAGYRHDAWHKRELLEAVLALLDGHRDRAVSLVESVYGTFMAQGKVANMAMSAYIPAAVLVRAGAYDAWLARADVMTPVMRHTGNATCELSILQYTAESHLALAAARRDYTEHAADVVAVLDRMFELLRQSRGATVLQLLTLGMAVVLASHLPPAQLPGALAAWQLPSLAALRTEFRQHLAQALQLSSVEALPPTADAVHKALEAAGFSALMAGQIAAAHAVE